MNQPVPGPLSPGVKAGLLALFDQLTADERGPVPACRCGHEIEEGQDPFTCGHEGT